MKLTSIVSGPLMQRILSPPVRRRIVDVISNKTYAGRLSATEREAAIQELCATAAGSLKLEAADIARVAIAREDLGSTALGDEVAVPHARLENISAPLIAVGLSAVGIDFDAPDGKPARILFLLLTPAHDDIAQVELLADIAKNCLQEDLRDKLSAASSYTEFRALLMTAAEDPRGL